MPSLYTIFRRMAGRRYYRAVLLVGVLLAILGLKELAQAAVFVHEAERVSAVVVDVTQKPFLSPYRAFLGGNWKAETAYYPHVNYQLPGEHPRFGRVLPDADADNHRYGEQVDILIRPDSQGSGETEAHLAAWKFIWGEATVHFCGGILLALFGRLLRGGKRRRAAHPAHRAPERKQERTPEHRDPPHPRAAAPAPRREVSKGRMEPTPDVEDAPPAKPKRRRKAAATSADGAPKTPRKRKKKED